MATEVAAPEVQAPEVESPPAAAAPEVAEKKAAKPAKAKKEPKAKKAAGTAKPRPAAAHPSYAEVRTMGSIDLFYFLSWFLNFVFVSRAGSENPEMASRCCFACR
jgi:hypothetical protein